MPLPLYNSSYLELQPCSSDLPGQQAELVPEKLHDHHKSGKNQQNDMCDTHKWWRVTQNNVQHIFTLESDSVSSTSPADAVHRVFQQIFSEHQDEIRTTRIPKKPICGSRLRSTTELNITEDESVLRQLQEREAKRNKVKSNRSKTVSDTSINANKRKATSSIETQTKTKRPAKDIDVALALRSLQTVIDSIDDDQLSDCVSEEFWFPVFLSQTIWTNTMH